MIEMLLERLRQKRRTVGYPKTLPVLPQRFRGRPFIHADRCIAANGGTCRLCADVCPVRALTLPQGSPALHLGICTFCGACANACPRRAIVFSRDWRLASTSYDALVITPKVLVQECAAAQGVLVSADAPPRELSQEEEHALLMGLPPLPVTRTTLLDGAFKHSFRLRQVSAGGCNACEADLNVLTTIVFDLMRFGIDFVASPRHADALVLTGPLGRNMQAAFKKCYAAMPEPKVIIAVGACGLSGGLFRAFGSSSSAQSTEGAQPHGKVDLFIPGCPPHPYTSLDGLLRFIGKIEG